MRAHQGPRLRKHSPLDQLSLDQFSTNHISRERFATADTSSAIERFEELTRQGLNGIDGKKLEESKRHLVVTLKNETFLINLAIDYSGSQSKLKKYFDYNP